MCLQGIVTIKDIRTPSPAEDAGKKPSMNWYLRKKDGEIYGPVDLETLQLWATDSRIAPEDEASTDREHWSPASGIPDLGMDWVVELRDGVAPAAEVAEEIITYVRDRLAHYKAPRSVDFVDELPRLPTGKLAKRVLINRYVEAH